MTTPITSTTTLLTLPGSCHCGAIRFLATLPDGFSRNTCRRCTCSYCSMRGAIIVGARDPAATGPEPSGIRFLDPSTGQPLPHGVEPEALGSYKFNTMVAEHFFCSRCGVNTHHRRRSDPRSFGVNVACLEGVSPFDFEEIDVADGVNHPNDTGKGSQMVGKLRFEKTGK